MDFLGFKVVGLPNDKPENPISNITCRFSNAPDIPAEENNLKVCNQQDGHMRINTIYRAILAVSKFVH